MPSINLTDYIPDQIAGIDIASKVKGPLASLYGNDKYDKTIIRYPRDLGTNPARKHSIVFTVMENDPKQLGEAASQVVQAVGKIGKAISSSNTNVTQLLTNPMDAISGIVNNREVQSAINDITNNFSASTIKLNRKPGPTIGLYIPDTVNVSYSVGYDENVSLSDALGKFYYLAQGAVSLAKQFTNQGEFTLTNMLNKAGSDPFVRDLAFSTVGKMAGMDLTRLGLNAGGYAMNPQLQVLFRSIGFRSFQFDFIFTPHNAQESDTVKDIIRLFKYHSAPQIDNNGVFAQGSYMKVPDAFDIKFLYGGKENSNVNRIGECVLKDLSVDYAGGGQWSTFNDGKPNQIKMTLQFVETVIVDKNRINQGY